MRNTNHQSAGCEFTDPYLYSFFEPATQAPPASSPAPHSAREPGRHRERTGNKGRGPARPIRLLDRRPETARLLFLLGLFPYF